MAGMEHASGKLNDFAALTFDCYGTLIDWETGIWDAFQPLIAVNGQAVIARDTVLEAFGQQESRIESASPGLPYPEVLARAHEGVARQLGLESNPRLNAEFGQSVPHWPAFADTAIALRFLKTRFKLVVLSNVHREGFAASNRKLGVAFDAVYTAEDIGSYKPSPANFDYLLGHLGSDFGLSPASVLHTAQSLFHDHAPAKAIGLATAWIDRQGLSESGQWGATARPDNMPEPDYRFRTMAEMAAAVATETGAPA